MDRVLPGDALVESGAVTYTEIHARSVTPMDLYHDEKSGEGGIRVQILSTRVSAYRYNNHGDDPDHDAGNTWVVTVRAEASVVMPQIEGEINARVVMLGVGRCRLTAA